MRKSRARSRSADKHGVHISKFVYHKSCVNLLWLRNFYRPNAIPYPYVLDSKQKSTRHVGVSTKETDLADRQDRPIGVKQILPHLFAVLGVVCGADTISAKSGMSQDVAPLKLKLKLKSCNELVEHEYALRKYDTTQHNKKTRSNFNRHHCSLRIC